MPKTHPKPLGVITPMDIQRFEKYVDRTPGHGPKGDCWIWVGSRDEGGYGKFYLNGSAVLAHRFAFISKHGETEKLILHTCDNPPCVNGLHAYSGSTADNGRDMTERKRCPDRHGERNPCSKVSDSQREEIRKLYATGAYSYRALGKSFGLHNSTIRDITTHGRLRKRG